MTALSLNGFLSWEDQVAALDWPIDLETFSGRAAAASLGWSKDGFPWRFAGGPTGPSTVVALPDSSGVVTVLSCTLAKADSADEPLRDCFLRYEEAGTRAWGTPFRVEVEEPRYVAWEHPSGTVVEIVLGGDVVIARFFTPQGTPAYE